MLILIEVALHGKDYYAASLYPPLFAFGAVAIEGRRCARPPCAACWSAVVAAVGLIGMPMALPVLPVDRFVAYERALGYKPAPMETRALSDLPQLYADMFGWREMAQAGQPRLLGLA